MQENRISAGNGYYIEILETGDKILQCPDDVPGEIGNGIAADRTISLFRFKKMCAEFIREREMKNSDQGR